MSSTGGLGSAATVTYKRLASSLASKWDQTYSDTMSWLRCRISFSLLRSSIQGIRGVASSPGFRAISLRMTFDPPERKAEAWSIFARDRRRVTSRATRIYVRVTRFSRESSVEARNRNAGYAVGSRIAE